MLGRMEIEKVNSPKLREQQTRQRFTAKYKISNLVAADRFTERGQFAESMRRSLCSLPPFAI